MAAPQPLPADPDRRARQILGLCAVFAAAVPVFLLVGVVGSGPGPAPGAALAATLALSLASLGWAVPAGLLLAPVLYRAERPVLQVVLGTLRDLPTVAVAVLLAQVGGHGLLAGAAVGLVVLPHVALGAAQALERSPPAAFHAAMALGLSRRRFALRIGLPRVRGPVAACLVRAWGRGVGEALITQTALGAAALSGSVLTAPGAARPAAAVLLAVAVGVPLLAHRLERA